MKVASSIFLERIERISSSPAPIDATCFRASAINEVGDERSTTDRLCASFSASLID